MIFYGNCTIFNSTIEVADETYLTPYPLHASCTEFSMAYFYFSCEMFGHSQKKAYLCFAMCALHTRLHVRAGASGCENALGKCERKRTSEATKKLSDNKQKERATATKRDNKNKLK